MFQQNKQDMKAKAKHITFNTSGYGHVRASAWFNNEQFWIITDDTKLTDMASDPEAIGYRKAYATIKRKLESAYALRNI